MYYFGGMHAYWWFFWVFLWILFFSFMQRRYAAGEITSEEYEERRTKLVRDVNPLTT
jgi:putative membrane protein